MHGSIQFLEVPNAFASSAPPKHLTCLVATDQSGATASFVLEPKDLELLEKAIVARRNGLKEGCNVVWNATGLIRFTRSTETLGEQ